MAKVQRHKGKKVKTHRHRGTGTQRVDSTEEPQWAVEENTTVRTYRDLLVWQKAMQLVTAIYRSSQDFPKNERYVLTAQLRRSIVSIPSNIAEGYGRNSTQDYIRCLRIAVGSLYECQTQLEIAKNLQFITAEQFDPLYSDSREIERMLTSLIRNLKK